MDLITHLGPHVHRTTTPAVEQWIRKAPIVKALDDVFPLGIAHPNAYRIYRRTFQHQGLDWATPDLVAKMVLDGLKDYRHPKLYVEMFVGVPPADYVEHAKVLRAFTEIMHASNVLVCGPSWYDGNGNPDQVSAFDFVDAWASQGYWGNTPDGVEWGKLPSRLSHALRYRSLFPVDRPRFQVEVGRDYVPDEGTHVAGQKRQGVSNDVYFGECLAADTEYRNDNVYATLYSAGPFDVPDDPNNQGPFETAELASYFVKATVEPVEHSNANPWRGNGLVVWNLPPDPLDVIGRAALIGARYVDIKVHDGDSPWTERRHVTREYVRQLRDSGLSVTGWGYVYCDGQAANGRDRGNGQNEYHAAIERVEALGLDGYTADFEIEAEGNPDLVQSFLREVTFELEVPVAAMVWGTLYQHEATPAEEICKHVNVLRPMVYRPTWAMDQFYDHFPAMRSWASLWDGVVCPVVGVTDNFTDDKLRDDLVVAQKHGAAGVSVWEWSAVGANERARLVREFGSVQPPPVDNSEERIDELRKGLLDLSGQLVNLGRVNEGYAVQYAIKLAKGELS